MPRLNSGQEIFKELTSLSKYIIQPTTPGDELTTVAVAVGDSTVTVAGTTNFADLEPVFIIGDGGTELNAIAGSPVAAMPVLYKTAFAQSIGARFVEALEIPLGHIDEAGVTYGATRPLTPVESAVSRLPIAFIAQGADMVAGFNLLGYNNLNLQEALGMTENETGAGTLADPYQVGIGRLDIGNQGVQCYRALGVRKDLSTVQVDFLNATVEVSLNSALGANTPATYAVSIKFTELVQRIWS